MPPYASAAGADGGADAAQEQGRPRQAPPPRESRRTRRNAAGAGDAPWQLHTDEALVHLPNHADPATYTAADKPVWAGVLAIHHAQEEHCVQPNPAQSVLRDGGPTAITNPGLWCAQSTQPQPEREGQMVDPASCTRHSSGNDLTKHAGANRVCLTTYSVSRPDPGAPAGFDRPTNQSMGTTILLQGRVMRPLPSVVGAGSCSAAVKPSSELPAAAPAEVAPAQRCWC